MATTTMRLEAELSDATSMQQVARLKALLGTGNADLIRSALLLMDWAVNQVAEGRQLASVHSGSVVREFSMPLLERARVHTRIALDPRAFGRLEEALAHPPTPSDALRRLLSPYAAAEDSRTP